MSEHKVTLLNNPYGQFAYENFRASRKAFADKSSVIEDLEDSNMTPFPVLLRPRRFGKSTFVHMLKCYYDVSYKDRFEAIFADTAIYKTRIAKPPRSEENEEIEWHSNYHVLAFDFSGISGKDSDTLVDSFIVAVNTGIIDFMARYPDFVFNPSETEKKTPSGFIKSFINAYKLYPQTKKLYLMIDEYDNFANNLLSEDLKLFKAITGTGGFIKDFYAAIKEGTGTCIAKTFITGVSSVSLDSLASGFNITLNVTSFACFNEYAGFTEAELAELIPQLVDTDKLGISSDEIIARMKPVYDGYCFSPEAESTVYNSSMCLYYINTIRRIGRYLPPEKYLDPASDHDGSKLQQLFKISDKRLCDEITETYLNNELFFLDKLAENINLNKDSQYNRTQLLSMMYYLGYLTIAREASDDSAIALKIPNLYMSKLFAQCVANLRFNQSAAFTDPELDITALLDNNDDISSFAGSCTEFLSSILTNQVLTHMTEMALNLTLYTKLNSAGEVIAEMQKSLRITGEGEKYADLVITVNKGKVNECIYLIELKYAAKNDAKEPRIRSLAKEASNQVLEYSTAMEFRNKKVKAYAMVFAGPECVYCQQQMGK